VHGRPQRRQLLHHRIPAHHRTNSSLALHETGHSKQLAQANREIPDTASATGDEGRLAVKRPSPRTGADRLCRGHPLRSADFPAAPPCTSPPM
jgi:hypothetical protein